MVEGYNSEVMRALQVGTDPPWEAAMVVENVGRVAACLNSVHFTCVRYKANQTVHRIARWMCLK